MGSGGAASTRSSEQALLAPDALHLACFPRSAAASARPSLPRLSSNGRLTIDPV
jgi:hypothetical protein